MFRLFNNWLGLWSWFLNDWLRLWSRFFDYRLRFGNWLFNNWLWGRLRGWLRSGFFDNWGWLRNWIRLNKVIPKIRITNNSRVSFSSKVNCGASVRSCTWSIWDRVTR